MNLHVFLPILEKRNNFILLNCLFRYGYGHSEFYSYIYNQKANLLCLYIFESILCSLCSQNKQNMIPIVGKNGF